MTLVLRVLGPSVSNFLKVPETFYPKKLRPLVDASSQALELRSGHFLKTARMVLDLLLML